MTIEIASQLIHCKTSKELWTAAKELSGSNTRSRIILLKSEFQRTRKGSMKMEDYLSRMKTIADNLTLAGSSLSILDISSQIFAGLDAEYNPIVVSLSEKEDLTWVELQATLLTFENRLEQLNSFSNLSLSQATANVAQKNDFKDASRGAWRGQRGFRGGRFRGRGGRSHSKPICQVCNKAGHIAINC
ncbi:hypothetical protein L6164_018662 [Bauhinia variegata]|uniref:Uncharacterized protein n=1 Tax=Bauhinia variegata TaxID=167791 RepID=A0ACB9NBW2_BAUVA|nr:hypothetical protein L6164_018662 [Bauhinia variegata]